MNNEDFIDLVRDSRFTTISKVLYDKKYEEFIEYFSLYLNNIDKNICYMYEDSFSANLYVQGIADKAESKNINLDFSNKINCGDLCDFDETFESYKNFDYIIIPSISFKYYNLSCSVIDFYKFCEKCDIKLIVIDQASRDGKHNIDRELLNKSDLILHFEKINISDNISILKTRFSTERSYDYTDEHMWKSSIRKYKIKKILHD